MLLELAWDFSFLFSVSVRWNYSGFHKRFVHGGTSFFIHPGIHKTFSDLIFLVARDTTHYHHAQVQVRIKSHRVFESDATAIVKVIFAKIVFSDPPT
jgi:adenine-specific DNA methylase